MAEAEKYFTELAIEIPGAQEGKMFGALCLKAPNGKAFVLFKNGNIAIKLNGSVLDEALSLDGASVFEPSEGKQMNGWVQIPLEYQSKWKEYAHIAFNEAEKIEKKTSKTI